MSLADEIEAARKAVDVREVPIPEWNRTAYVWPITIKQWDTIFSESTDAMMAVRAITVRCKNEDGTPMFSKLDADKLITHAGGAGFTIADISAIAGRVNADIVEAVNQPDEAIANAEKN